MQKHLEDWNKEREEGRETLKSKERRGVESPRVNITTKKPV